MEQLSFSKYKLQLLALVTEIQELRESERRAKEELRLSVQQREQSEVDFGKKFREMREGLDACQESKQKLEGKVKYLQNDNAVLDMKIQELKGTVDNLLQSRDVFIKHYEDSTCELKHSIEMRDRKLSVLSQKLQAHLTLFGCLETEALALKQTLEKVEQVVHEKEQVVAELKSKMKKVTLYKEQFIEKIFLVENKLKTSQDELHRKTSIILELKEEIKEARDHCNCMAQIEEISIQKTLSVKEEVTQKLISEKQALCLEVQALEANLQRILPHVNTAIQEDAYPSTLEVQPRVTFITEDDNERTKDKCQMDSEDSLNRNTDQRTVDESEHSAERRPSEGRCFFETSRSELVFSPQQSSCSLAAVDVVDVSINGNKGSSCNAFVHQLDAERLTSLGGQ